jgi:hypothetical protein
MRSRSGKTNDALVKVFYARSVLMTFGCKSWRRRSQWMPIFARLTLGIGGFRRSMMVLFIIVAVALVPVGLSVS